MIRSVYPPLKLNGLKILKRSAFNVNRTLFINPSMYFCSDRGSKGDGNVKAVIFDMFGVVIPSPHAVFEEFGRRNGSDTNLLVDTILKNGNDGSWAKWERGELIERDFINSFQEEMNEHTGTKISVEDFYTSLHKLDMSSCPQMVNAIQFIRSNGLKTALLTNNWLVSPNESVLPVDKSLFDVIVESCVVNMRKPEKRIFDHVLKCLDVNADEAVFLDDLNVNIDRAKSYGIQTIKVDNTQQALSELEEKIGFPIERYVKGTSPIPDHLKLDMKKLKSYLNWALKLHDKVDPYVRYFSHGYSNPTYFINYAKKDLVLRKKPPGKTLQSAHDVQREYTIMKALKKQGIPVPKVLGFCDDDSLLGSPFYVMEYQEGRIFKHPTLEELTAADRSKAYEEMARVLSLIHKVNIDEAGLGDFAKKGGFLQRNIKRWTKQYHASSTDDVDDSMNKLIEWLPQNIPINEECTIAHGDYRMDNLIFHPNKIEVIGVIDWELSTLGDPLTDLVSSCFQFEVGPKDMKPVFTGIRGLDIPGIPSRKEYMEKYYNHRDITASDSWDYYLSFCLFRYAAILQGVYKRSTMGQSSSKSAQHVRSLVKVCSDMGWAAACRHQTFLNTQQANDGEMNSAHYKSQENLPLSVSSLSPFVQNIHAKVTDFIEKEVIVREDEAFNHSLDQKTKWTELPFMEDLKNKIKKEGLFNLYLPLESDPERKYGVGLTNVEYSFMCEEMGKSVHASEVFNCSAPDTGNMEVLVRYGTDEQKEKWLKPLLNGEIRSCFAMTEPGVASSDATNIQSSIIRDGDEYIINGRKWWTSGAMHPRCKICIFMGKTDVNASIHKQQSMILVPMDTPGVNIVRPLNVLGFDDAPHGHAEMLFENVRVPASNLLLGEGRGFEIAQGRLGPGRIHHCMRLIGMSERALALMIERVQERIAFKKTLSQQGTIQQDIAKSRIEIEQCRLLVLKAAHMMDLYGNKVAAPEIAMIKVATPRMAQEVIDRAMQAFGGAGLSQDTPLAAFFAWARILRLADGPDEVHVQSIAKMELKKNIKSKI